MVKPSFEKDIYITVRLTNSAEIQELNKKFLKRDFPTDVLSFNYDQPMEDGSVNLGDIVVSVDQAKMQSGDFGNDLAHEIAALVEHGVLHLLGVHHTDDDANNVHDIRIKK